MWGGCGMGVHISLGFIYMCLNLNTTSTHFIKDDEVAPMGYKQNAKLKDNNGTDQN